MLVCNLYSFRTSPCRPDAPPRERGICKERVQKAVYLAAHSILTKASQHATYAASSHSLWSTYRYSRVHGGAAGRRTSGRIRSTYDRTESGSGPPRSPQYAARPDNTKSNRAVRCVERILQHHARYSVGSIQKPRPNLAPLPVATVRFPSVLFAPEHPVVLERHVHARRSIKETRNSKDGQSTVRDVTNAGFHAGCYAGVLAFRPVLVVFR